MPDNSNLNNVQKPSITGDISYAGASVDGEIIIPLSKIIVPTASAETLPAGDAAFAHVDNEWHFTFGVPEGLQGPQGMPGQMGPIGPQGPRGLQGNRGEIGPKGETGNGIYSTSLTSDYELEITFTDGSVYTTQSIRGPRGERGVPGPQGEAGEPGETGPQGEQGPEGPPGETGNGIESIRKIGSIGDSDVYLITFTSGGSSTFSVKNRTNGTDGYSPVARVNKSGKVATITITDKTGTTTATVNDGINGVDGYSPTANVSKSGKVSTITITDKNGTTTAQVLDGADGEGAEPFVVTITPIDLTSGNADKTNGEIAEAYLAGKKCIIQLDLSLLNLGTLVADMVNCSSDETGQYSFEAFVMQYPAEEFTVLWQGYSGPSNTRWNVSSYQLSEWVSSVNGYSGDVVLDAFDVGALPSSTLIPTKTSDLTNDSGFVNAAGAASAAPVQSINGKTGIVSLVASDVGAGTYSKPSSGIPSSDMSTGVQTSLGKADTALQNVPNTYRTASAQDVIDATFISKPSSPTTGSFLVWDGSAWVAQTLATWQGGSY